MDESGALVFDKDGKPIPVQEDPLAGLKQAIVVLEEGEAPLPLYAEPSADAEVLAELPNGEMLYVRQLEEDWTYAVYGELEGYVMTSKIALYNADPTPGEEEIVRTITVSSSLEGVPVVYAGTEVTMTATLTGFEDVAYTMQWQYTPDGGETVVDVEGANGPAYTFTIDDGNYAYLWRLVVTLQPEPAESGAQA